MTDQLMSEQVNWRKWYWHFGLSLTIRGSQLIGDCPFCGKNDHYYIGSTNGIGTCQRSGTEECEGSNNHWLFLRKLHKVSLEDTTDNDYKELSTNRNIKTTTLQHFQLCKNKLNDQWLIPSFNQKSNITNLYQCYEETEENKVKYEIRSAPNPCQQGLYGLETLKKQTKIYLCEGHWDRMVLAEIIAHLKKKDNTFVRWGKPDWDSELFKQYAVLALPGANVFKDQWTQFFKKREVSILHDNDQPGRNMLKRVGNKMMGSKHQPTLINSLNWECSPNCNDIRDLVSI